MVELQNEKQQQHYDYDTHAYESANKGYDSERIPRQIKPQDQL